MTAMIPGTFAAHLGPEQVQRVVGALLGQAVGDALGAPFEFRPAGTYATRFPEPVLGGIGELVGGGGFGWAPGEFTDDTQMAVVLALSLLEHKGYEPDAVWSRWRTWARTASDVGVTTRASLAHDDWRSVPASSRGAGNGALMRVAPLALALLDAPYETVRTAVLHQAALTHTDPAAGWGALVAVEMIRAGIRGGDVFAARDAVLGDMPAEVGAPFAPLLAPTWSPDQPAPSNGTVWGCLAQAVWCVRSTSSFEHGVTTAVNLGDDADTVAAVTGAIAGARYGRQAIPSRWTTYVHGSVDGPDGVECFTETTLTQLAMALVGIPSPGLTTPEPAAGPVEVAPGLFAADLMGAVLGAPRDWAVVSLTRTADRFAQHPVRRQVFLEDKRERHHNPHVEYAILQAVDAIEAFLAEGRTVVVHCHGGRSRTGVVLKAWRLRTHGGTVGESHSWLAERWDRYAELDWWREPFEELLRSLER